MKVADGLSVNDSRSYKQKTTNSSDFMFHYPMFVGCGDVERCRRMSNRPLSCRNSLNYVERQRKLLMQWRMVRNTQKLSSNGSPRPETASHNAAGKRPPPKLASCAPFGLRSELPLPMDKA